MRIEPRSVTVLVTAFLIGLLTQTSVNVVGNMPLAEFVTLTVLTVLIVRAAIEKRVPTGLFRMPLFWIFILAQIIAFAAYIFSDLYRGSSFNDMLRGWSRMIFLGIDVVAVASIFGAKASGFVWSQVGLMMGGLLAIMATGAKYDDLWKFGLGGPATIAICLIGPLFGRFAAICLIGALGILHLSLDFRSMGGVCLLGAMLLGVQLIPRQLRVLLLVPALAGAALLTFWMSSQPGGNDGTRGSRSTVERTAMIAAASEGILESPLIGQGSWFSNSRVMENFQLLRSEGARLAGVHGYAVESEETNIAIHSQILVSIAEGGIFGGTFFIVFGCMIGWALWYCTTSRVPDAWTPIFIYFLLITMWNLFLSPFSGGHRIGIAIGCGLILLLWREALDAAPDGEEEPEVTPQELPKLLEVRS